MAPSKILRATAMATVLAICAASARGQQATSVEAVEIDDNDIGGTVTGSAGPEAGAWVIAETRDLPIRYAKIAVTDNRGRFVIPDLPEATFDLWVRGYGLVDSPKIKAKPGAFLRLKSVDAPSDPDASMQSAQETHPYGDAKPLGDRETRFRRIRRWSGPLWSPWFRSCLSHSSPYGTNMVGCIAPTARAWPSARLVKAPQMAPWKVVSASAVPLAR
ncbi:MAG: carboxypeptidase-like regulatory domain-containing protein [Methylocystis sp.]|uniref:carboxypeptidase-like regulatory domain-containing protein n=1 Tax=Methylocystis sp. TaxID=1911079 RepID=UPI003DA23795